MSAAIAPKTPAGYMRLVRRFPLVHLRDDAHLDEAIAVIDGLLRLDLDEGQRAYLDVLTDLVEAYEARHVPMPAASGVEVLASLMESNNLSQSALSREVGISQSTISAVMRGKRGLTPGQMKVLGERFKVAPSAFMPG